jgi:predicted dinucleotide-binding enzyme
MRIAVIGAGNVGGTLGRRWATVGHNVVFGVRHPERGADAVKGGGALPSAASVATPADAVRGADVLLLATPWAVVGDAVRAAGAASGALDSLVVIDATNPIGAGLRVDAGPNGESGAERVQMLAPRARVVKAFNTTGWENLRDPSYPGGAATLFVASDDADAKATVRTLASDLGFDPVDAGPLVRARELEHLAVLWISMAVGAGVPPVGRDIAFRLMRR